MLSGAHMIIYSKNAEADKAFFRDVLKLNKVDVGHGWLIFGLPPAEIAVHPAEESGLHEIYLMCKDINAFVKDMAKQKIACSEVKDYGWGLLTQLTLPAGGKLGVYQPRHASPKPTAVASTSVKKKVAAKKKAAVKKKAAKKPVKKAKRK